MGERLTASIIRDGGRFQSRAPRFASGPFDRGPDPPLSLRFPEPGGAVRPAPGHDSESDRLRGRDPAQAPVPLPGRDGPRRVPRGDEGTYRGRKAEDARLLPGP